MRDLPSSLFLGGSISRRRRSSFESAAIMTPKKSSHYRTKRMFVVPLLTRKTEERAAATHDDPVREDPALWLNKDLMLHVFSFLVGESKARSFDRLISVLEVGALYFQLSLVSKTWKQLLDEELHELIHMDDDSSGRSTGGGGGMILDFNKCCRPNLSMSTITDALAAVVPGDGLGVTTRGPTLLDRIQLLVVGTGTGTTTIPDSSSTFPLIVRWMVKTGSHLPITTLRLPNSSVGLMPTNTTSCNYDHTPMDTTRFLTTEYQKYMYGVGILLTICNTQYLTTFSDGRMESSCNTTTAIRRRNSSSSSSSSCSLVVDDELEFQALIAKSCPNLRNLSITLFYNDPASTTTDPHHYYDPKQQLLISPALFSMERLENLFVKPIFPSSEVGTIVQRPNPDLFTNLISNLPSLTRLTIDGTCIPDYFTTTEAGRGGEGGFNNNDHISTYVHFDIASSSLEYLHGYGFLDRPNVKQCTNLLECTGFVPTVTQRLDDIVRQALSL